MKAYAKVNIVLKITAKRGNYHEIFSRFVKVPSLFDKISFVPKLTSKKLAFDKHFGIIGDFDCDVKDNTIYKAYKTLYEVTQSETLHSYFQNHSVKVIKNIPSFAGLGGGSSDAATFLKLCNQQFSLQLSHDELASIGANVGADVPFFIYEYNSANVTGIGEVVKEFKEEILDFDIYTPDINISTPVVFKTFREHYYHLTSEDKVTQLAQLTSKELLNMMSRNDANDLYLPAQHAYPLLKQHEKENYFFSGSGSSFFKLKES